MKSTFGFGNSDELNTLSNPLSNIASTMINKAGEAAGEWIKEKIHPTKPIKYQIDVNGNYSDSNSNLIIKNKNK